MSAEDNKGVVRRFQDAVSDYFRTGNLDLFDTARPDAPVDPDAAFDMPGMQATIEGMKQMLPAFRVAFPDLRVTLGELIAEGDKVAYRLTWTGTQTGEFMGIPATGKRVTVTETHIDQIANGKLVRHAGDTDQLGLLQQLGVVPAMG